MPHVDLPHATLEHFFLASYTWKPRDFDGKSMGSDVCPAPLSSYMMVGLTKTLERYVIHPISIRIPSDLVLHPISSISIPYYSLRFSAGKLPLNINLQHVYTILANPLFTTRHPQNCEVLGASTRAPSLLKPGPSRGWCHPGRTPGSPSRLCVPPPGVSPGRRPQELGMCHGQKKVYLPKNWCRPWQIGVGRLVSTYYKMSYFQDQC